VSAQPRPGDEEPSGGTLAMAAELADPLRAAADSVADDPPGGSGDPGEEDFAEEAEEVAGELKDTQDRLLRLQADFENFRRRALAERHDLYQYGHENLVKDLLSTVDNLDRAISHARDSAGGDLESFLQGVELVQRELLGTLEAHSVREIDAMGQVFDPALHEAMTMVPDGSVAPNTVIEVLQKGYVLRERLLRPARVIVARAPDAEKAEEGDAAD